jgi:hypothetical protein
VYCGVEDLRREGVTVETVADERLARLCELATNYIDVITGRWFEPRVRKIRIDGNGGAVLPLPHFLIEAESVKCDGVALSDYVLYDEPEDRDYPKLYRKRKWSRGPRNVEIHGSWGYVDFTDAGEHVTPPLIRNAARRLVLLELTSSEGGVADSSRETRGMLTEETTDGHSYKLNRDLTTLYVDKIYTGDMEIDQIIEKYIAPTMGLGLI